mmetsp:Transcript_55435/g.113360  ORF Transcript_55435/g.113360 Transcript_55435/m.113360 type:complete len:221 (-) Transcript_55435:130-792(-)
MIFSVSPDLSSASIALSFMPACVYFLVARWKFCCCTHMSAMRLSMSVRNCEPSASFSGSCSVIFSAIASVISTLCFSHMSIACFSCWHVMNSCTALSYCECDMKKSPTLRSSSGSVSLERSSAIARSESNSFAAKQISNALELCPPFWYSVTAASNICFASKYLALSSITRGVDCSASDTMSLSLPCMRARRTAWLNLPASLNIRIASSGRSIVSYCEAR